MKKVVNAKNGSKPIIAKIIEPVMIVRVTAIIGTEKFIIDEGLPLAFSSGMKSIKVIASH